MFIFFWKCISFFHDFFFSNLVICLFIRQPAETNPVTQASSQIVPKVICLK